MHLLIAAAGSGSRMKAGKNKLLLSLAGRTVLEWTLKAAIAAETITWIGVIGQSCDRASISKMIQASPKTIKWINGGNTRQESVQLGLAGLPLNAEKVLIHDGARCLIEPSLFNLCAEKVQAGRAVIAATPVTDTIKKVDQNSVVYETPQRSELWAAQTPQGFFVEDLKHGHEQALVNGWTVTDDASLYERLGWRVEILEASPSNIKVTTPFDLIVAEAVLNKRSN